MNRNFLIAFLDIVIVIFTVYTGRILTDKNLERAVIYGAHHFILTNSREIIHDTIECHDVARSKHRAHSPINVGSKIQVVNWCGWITNVLAASTIISSWRTYTLPFLAFTSIGAWYHTTTIITACFNCRFWYTFDLVITECFSFSTFRLHKIDPFIIVVQVTHHESFGTSSMSMYAVHGPLGRTRELHL